MKNGKNLLVGAVVIAIIGVVLGIVAGIIKLIICMVGVVEHANLVSGRCYNNCDFEPEE